jgi:cytochrome c553
MKSTLAALAGALCLSLATAHAGNLEAGRKKSEPCAACHGAVGISPNTDWPNLAGQQKAYLVKQMKAFRDGERTDPWMSPMAKELSDEDMADLASFFNSLPVRDEYQ